MKKKQKATPSLAPMERRKGTSRPKAKTKKTATEKVSSDVAKISFIAGNNFYDIAQVKAEGREENLKKAIEAYNRVLSFYALKEHPFNYAMTQNNLGNAYRGLSEVRDKEANIKLAIKAYNEALKVRTLEAFPIDYAGTKFNVGLLYRLTAEMAREKGDKGQERESLKMAETAFKESQESFKKEGMKEWTEKAEKGLADVRNLIGQIKD